MLVNFAKEAFFSLKLPLNIPTGHLAFSAQAVYSVCHSVVIPLLMVSRASIIQEIVPSHMTGRIFSLVSMAVVGMSAVSSGIAGVVLEFITAPQLFLIIGITGGMCGVIGWIFARDLWKQA